MLFEFLKQGEAPQWNRLVMRAHKAQHAVWLRGQGMVFLFERRGCPPYWTRLCLKEGAPPLCGLDFF